MHDSHKDWKGCHVTRHNTQTMLYCGGRGYWRTVYNQKSYDNEVKFK